MAKKHVKKTPVPEDPAAPVAADVAESFEDLTLTEVSDWIRSARKSIPTLPDPDAE